jgi:hypothetical protein
VKAADAVFIAVGTPSRRGDGHADLSFVYDAAREIASAIEDRYLRTEAMIDARFAKIMARLVGLKEYKKVYGQKPIEALPPVAAQTMLPAAELSADTEAQAAPTARAIKQRKLCDKYLGCFFRKRRGKPQLRSLARCRSTGQGAGSTLPALSPPAAIRTAYSKPVTRFASTSDNASNRTGDNA